MIKRLSRRSMIALGAFASAGLVPVAAVLTYGDLEQISSWTPPETLSMLLSDRSPGKRTSATLTKTKAAKARELARNLAPHQRALARNLVPQQRALPKVQPAKPNPSFGEVLLGQPPATLIAAAPAALQVLPPIALAGTSPAIGGIFIPPAGGGGGGGGGGPGPVAEVPPPTTVVTPPANIPAVPEPATWMMLLIGFFGCGLMVRRSALGRLQAAS